VLCLRRSDHLRTAQDSNGGLSAFGRAIQD
jgi:hypothetical protein